MSTFGQHLATKGAPANDGPEFQAFETLLGEIRDALDELVTVAKRPDTEDGKLAAALSKLADALKREGSEPAQMVDAIKALRIAPANVTVDVKPTPIMAVNNMPPIQVMPAPEVDTTFDVVIAPAARDGSRRMTITRTSKKPE